LAGDIAARMADRDGRPTAGGEVEPELILTAEERSSALTALGCLVQGEGLTMVVQPIVDIRTGEVHAFEALARFGEARLGPAALVRPGRAARRPAGARAGLPARDAQLVQGFRLSRPGEPWPEVDAEDTGRQQVTLEPTPEAEQGVVIDPSEW
jgi:hypothetical protein